MKKIQQQLLAVLHSIEGNGSFTAAGSMPFTPPGLHVRGVGEVALPLIAAQAAELIKTAKLAPFGKGRETITDIAVRNTWEIDAAELSFKNPDWAVFFEKILDQTKAGLGLEGQPIAANLYKLLLYEKGGHFAAHRDSEKEKGMFGTLTVGLPSAHAGGELVVRFDGREQTFGFAADASGYRIPFAAFFADCEHEIRPVTAGFRVSLVYNLVFIGAKGQMPSPAFSKKTDQLAALLASIEPPNEPKAILLGHQYTPENFSWQNLKHHDRPRADALAEAARKAGYFAGLGLVTHYKMGDLEGGDDGDDHYGRGSYGRRRREPTEPTMGEVHEESTDIKHWATDGQPGLGAIEIEPEEDILTNLEIGEGDPTEQEGEDGYMGNYAPSIEYWYHYGAVILWHRSIHEDLLIDANAEVRLGWLQYYLENWAAADLDSPKFVRGLIAGMAKAATAGEKTEMADHAPVAAGLLQLADQKFLEKSCAALLESVFRHIPVADWLGLLKGFPPDVFFPIFEKTGRTGKVSRLLHLLSILEKLVEEKPKGPLLGFFKKQLQQLPDFLKTADLADMGSQSYFSKIEKSPTEKRAALIGAILRLAPHAEADPEWAEQTWKRMVRSLPRPFVNEILAPVLLDKSLPTGGILAKKLHATCTGDLAKRTAVMPLPPPDWKRELPKTDREQEIWKLLSSFMASPTERFFDYRMAQSYRTSMENTVTRATVDLRTETIRTGSPHILRLIKTQAAYELSLKNWTEDCALLAQLRG